jgi:[ribosomal protein S5]-alanine N-acetyltransferase
MLTVNFQPFPILTTERLILRPVTEGDVSAIFALRSDPEVMRFVCRPLVQNEAEAKVWFDRIDQSLQANEGINWAICWKNDPKMFGSMALWRFDKENYRAELGYMIPPQYWGQGIISEALAAVIPYAFNDLKLHSLEGQIDPRNAASGRVLEKQGFRQEAYFRENLHYNGEFLDTAVFSLLEKWWKEKG